jgi:hypothetical protein
VYLRGHRRHRRRATGARRELLTAPIPRALIVLGNMAAAIGVSLLQVGALMAAGWLRGSHFHATASGVAWFTGAVLAFTVFMYGLAGERGRQDPSGRPRGDRLPSPARG